MKKENKGITLVALVVTVVILLILAGISIASLTGKGLFEKAKLAKEKQENAQFEEDDTLGEYEETINSAVVGTREQIMVDKAEYEQLKKDVESLKTRTTNAYYSTEEQVVGTWINGKTIYQKTININAKVDTSGVATGLTNIEELIWHSINASEDGYQWTIEGCTDGRAVWFNTDCSILYGNPSYSVAYKLKTLTIRYTKTTD